MPTNAELADQVAELKTQLATATANLTTAQMLLAAALAAPQEKGKTDDELLEEMEAALNGVVAGVERSPEEVAATEPMAAAAKAELFKKLDEAKSRGPQTLGRALLKVGMEIGLEYLKAQSGAGAAIAVASAVGAATDASSAE